MQKTYEKQNKEMISSIEYEVKMTAQYTGINKLSSKVLKALKAIPRHLFVEAIYTNEAYLDKPISIGYRQTTSQPFIIAIMIELLDIVYGDKILEIGTGSGYQTAILSKLSNEIYTVEIIPQLLIRARRKFQELKMNNIHSCIGNGADGWIENAPFDKIIVSAACENIPAALIEQLKPTGIMILPIYKKDETQVLTVIKKELSGKICVNETFSVRFVPLVGG